MVPNVESGVGKRVESDGLPRSAEACRLRIRILGPLEIRRDGAVLPLPASRKVRALLAYLALAPREASRSQLCELLWDVPTDPRGELRWCLSKIRRLVDDGDHHIGRQLRWAVVMRRPVEWPSRNLTRPRSPSIRSLLRDARSFRRWQSKLEYNLAIL